MSVEVTLEYKRASSAVGVTTSTGRVLSIDGGLITEEGAFEFLSFKEMISKLHDTLKHWPDEEPIDIIIRRTDRDGLQPHKLDPATVNLIRVNPLAAIQALSVPDRSPSGEVRKVHEATVPIVIPPLKVGDDVLADAFGDQLYFKVRGHELECPCCGFWGMFTTPGLLNDTDRAGASFKTVFQCGKRCLCRIQVTCNTTWGYVSTEHLLKETLCSAFFFPRAWNGGRPWVTRDALRQMYEKYKKEKEQAS
jgi:hypothetical protein